MKSSTILSFLALALPFASATQRRRHHHRSNTDVNVAAAVEKRSSFTPARFTFYDVGLGACGKYNEPDELVVALNIPQFGPGYPGDQCFKPITITFGGKSVNATIVDKCEQCPYSGLDFSRGLFNQFAEESVGVLYGEWLFL